jgi:uncharacterized protein (TIGR03435 family)
MKLAVVLLLCSADGTLLCQQGQTPSRPEFEVASIKSTLVNQNQPISLSELGIFVTPTSVDMKNVTLRTIIARAFGVTTLQIVGPETIMSETLYVKAKIPAGATRSQIPDMIQNLLRDRFGLESHKEPRSVKGGEVSIENPEALRKQLAKESSGPPPKEIEHPVRLTIPLSSLAEPLSGLLGMPVVLMGIPENDDKYIFWLETADGPSSIAKSLKQYGIRLTFGKVDVKYIIVDKINKVPTEN